jgi:hypothetical protein
VPGTIGRNLVYSISPYQKAWNFAIISLALWLYCGQYFEAVQNNEYPHCNLCQWVTCVIWLRIPTRIALERTVTVVCRDLRDLLGVASFISLHLRHQRKWLNKLPRPFQSQSTEFLPSKSSIKKKKQYCLPSDCRQASPTLTYHVFVVGICWKQKVEPIHTKYSEFS